MHEYPIVGFECCRLAGERSVRRLGEPTEIDEEAKTMYVPQLTLHAGASAWFGEGLALLEVPSSGPPQVYPFPSERGVFDGADAPRITAAPQGGSWRLYGARDDRAVEHDPRSSVVDVQPGAVVLAHDRWFVVCRTRRTPRGQLACQVGDVIAASPPSLRALATCCRAARGTVSVLLAGESGTGKELYAAMVHACSDRACGPFSAINCAAIGESMADSELFGHVRGAFTGAIRDHQGLFRSAHGGTLFLDEVAELALPLQAKLLRTLEAGEVRPVGSTRTHVVDVRLVAATHRPIDAWARDGAFRHDLLYRLQVMRIHLPPLRDRTDDIEPLALSLRDRLSLRLELEPSAWRALEAHDWPGNVRELRNALERLALMCPFRPATGVDVREALAGAPAAPPPRPPRAPLEDLRNEHILAELIRNGGHRKATYERLGLSKSSFYRWLRAHEATVARALARSTQGVDFAIDHRIIALGSAKADSAKAVPS